MPSRFQSIPQPPDLVQQVVDQMMALISSGELTGGDAIPPEAILLEQFGVSRTVTREAMQMLRGLGVIESSRGRRARVRELGTDTTIDNLHLHLRLSSSTLLDQIEFRTPVECYIAELACSRRSPDHIVQMRAAVDDLREGLTPEASVDADLRFHRTLAAATGNSLFESTLGAIGELMRKAMGIEKHGSTKSLMDGIHENILDAVSRRDAVDARKAMQRHMVEGRKILIDTLRA